MRVRPRPEFKASRGVEFGDFIAAAGAVREIAQSGLHPANCRLLDASEAELTGAGDGSANLLILGFESAHHPVDAAMDAALEIARAHGGVGRRATGQSPSAGGGEVAARSSAWRGAFLLAPYLRDTFVACGVLSETFETAVTWDRFEEFHASVMAAARKAVAASQRRAGRGSSARPGSAAASPTSIPTASRPTSRCWRRRCAAARSSSGTRSRPRSPRR